MEERPSKRARPAYTNNEFIEWVKKQQSQPFHLDYRPDPVWEKFQHDLDHKEGYLENFHALLRHNNFARKDPKAWIKAYAEDKLGEIHEEMRSSLHTQKPSISELIGPTQKYIAHQKAMQLPPEKRFIGLGTYLEDTGWTPPEQLDDQTLTHMIKHGYMTSSGTVGGKDHLLRMVRNEDIPYFKYAIFGERSKPKPDIASLIDPGTTAAPGAGMWARDFTQPAVHKFMPRESLYDRLHRVTEIIGNPIDPRGWPHLAMYHKKKKDNPKTTTPSRPYHSMTPADTFARPPIPSTSAGDDEFDFDFDET